MPFLSQVIKTTLDQLPLSERKKALFILDDTTELPSCCEKLLKVLKNKYTNIIILSVDSDNSYKPMDKLVEEVNQKLIRGCMVHHVEQLSNVESTQRIVYSVMRSHNLTPNNEDRKVFEKLGEMCSSPSLVELFSKCLLAEFKKFGASPVHVQEVIGQTELNVAPDCKSCDLALKLIQNCKLSPEERLLFNTLCIFGSSPVPYSLVIELSSLISTASQKLYQTNTLPSRLLEICLMKKYPSPVVLFSSSSTEESQTHEPEFVCIPQCISQYAWQSLKDGDRIIALSLVYKTLSAHTTKVMLSKFKALILPGLCGLLYKMCEHEFELIGEECFKSVHGLYLQLLLQDQDTECNDVSSKVNTEAKINEDVFSACTYSTQSDHSEAVCTLSGGSRSNTYSYKESEVPIKPSITYCEGRVEDLSSESELHTDSEFKESESVNHTMIKPNKNNLEDLELSLQPYRSEISDKLPVCRKAIVLPLKRINQSFREHTLEKYADHEQLVPMKSTKNTFYLHDLEQNRKSCMIPVVHLSYSEVRLHRYVIPYSTRKIFIVNSHLEQLSAIESGMQPQLVLPFYCKQNASKFSYTELDLSFQCVIPQLQPSVLHPISIPSDSHTLCVIGSPSIESVCNKKEWQNLGKLRHVRHEMEWVAFVLRTSPIMKDNATKSKIFEQLSYAKLIHIATYGDKSSAFLAFSPSSSTQGISVNDKDVNTCDVLLVPEEVEKLSIAPLLVVISCCNIGPAAAKRLSEAFIRAGAQSVLTTLQTVPAEYICIFMKFFYKYLLSGLRSSQALHKTFLSLNCYSDSRCNHCHHDCFELTQLRDIQFEVNLSPSTQMLLNRLGSESVLPCVDVLKKLHTELCLTVFDSPTDVQVLHVSRYILNGCLYAQNYCSIKTYSLIFITIQMVDTKSWSFRPIEAAKDFIRRLIHSQFVKQFSGRIFWISCARIDYINASIDNIKKVRNTKYP